VLFPNNENCRAFIECRDNYRLDRDCGQGKLFETSTRECLNDFVVNCGSRQIISEQGNVESIQRITQPQQMSPRFLITNVSIKKLKSF
jgi:hypothetical protein